ncbi:MAG: glycosyltransferase family 39 protein, partial [Desulfofustis sp.]|nr:glycosyltransferase family 39 protein [Desulfofustis sp.]
MQGVSIIIPTRNEADNIDHLLRRIFAVDFLQSIDHEVIFVDDSSTDLTRDHIRQWCGCKPVILIERDGGGGLASAVVAGAEQSRYGVALVMDADLSHPPEKIPELVEPLLAGDADMVIGSRYVEGGATPEWPRSRRIASKLATLPARLFTDVNDPMAGFFGTTTERLKSLRQDIPGFKIGLELLAVGGDDLRVQEVPIIFSDRFEGFSKMNKRIIFEYLKQVAQLSRYRSDVFTWTRLALLLIIGTIGDVAVFIGMRQAGIPAMYAHLGGGGAGAALLLLSMDRMIAGSGSRPGPVLGPLSILPVLFIYALSLQGGVFYLLGSYQILPDLAQFIPAAALGSGCFMLSVSIFVFSDFFLLSKRVQAKLAVISTVAALVLLRLVYLGLPELMEQEAYYWNYAQHPSLSYLDHPPMAALLIGLGSTLLGISEFAVRIGAFCCWFFTAFFAYRLAADIFGRTAAWGSVLLVSILPLYFGSGFVITPDSPLHAAWAAFVYFLYRAVISGRKKAWIGVGISLGIGMLSKYTIVLLAPGILLFLLVDGEARRWFLKPQPYLALLMALALFSPVLIWNYQHDWVSFLFQGEQRVAGQSFFTTHRLLAYIALLLTPAGVVGICWFLLGGNRFFKTALPAADYSGRAISRE